MSVNITVVTPSFNQAKFLDETIRSVLCQRDQVHEYFVIDGGSNDGSADIIRRYENQIDYWVSEKDRGQADAIHKGFSRATGDFLFWLNSDDVLLPDALRKMRQALERHPDWDVLTAYHAAIDSETRIESVHRIPRQTARAARWGVIHVTQQTCIFRRSLYEQVGGIDLSLHCMLDTELWIRMFEAGSRWGHIPEFLAAFRHHPLAKGSSWLKKYDEEIERIRPIYPRYRQQCLKHQLGMLGYRLSQIASGRHIRALLESRRVRGKKLTDVFGDWTVNSEAMR